MLASKGFENGEFLGLNWIEGSVKKIEKNKPRNKKIPHMGWNDQNLKKNNSFIKIKRKNWLFKCFSYFVHSYNFYPKDPDDKIITTSYGRK